MPDLYTPQSNTQQGNQFESLNKLLASIQSMPGSSPQVSPQQVAGAQSNAMNFQSQIPGQLQQQQQSLTQQSGIPQLQSQYGNLSNIFQLYLHDQNLSQKYASPQLSTGNSPVYQQPNTPNPVTGEVSSVPNPYLNSPADLVKAVTQPSGQGFQGFTSPSMNTGAISQVPGATSNIMNLLQGAIGSEQGIVQNKMGDVSQNYQTASSLLSNIANIFSQERQNQLTLSQPGGAVSVQNSISSLVSDIKKGATLKDIMAKYTQDPNLTADKILQLYNSNSPHGSAKETPEELASTYGVTGGFGKQPPSVQKIMQNGQVIGTFNPKTGETKYISQLSPQQIDSFKNVQDTSNKILQEFESMNPLEKLPVPGMEHISPLRAKINAQISSMLPDLRKTAIGGRLTNKDITILQSKFPVPGDTNDVAEAKIKVVIDEINKKLTQGGYTIGGGGGASGSSGTGGNSKDPLGIL